MSAARPLRESWKACSPRPSWAEGKSKPRLKTTPPPALPDEGVPEPEVSLAFYRKHTESMLKRYLYASMQVGRSPSLLTDSVGRGWVSSHPVRTFEDAVIFVLDVENCLNKLDAVDRDILGRVVLQEYTYAEAAELLGMSIRTVCSRCGFALDRLTRILLDAGLLLLPH